MIKKILFLIGCLIICISCEKKNMHDDSKVLRINFCLKPRSFHPHRLIDASDLTICKNLFEGLTRVNLKGEVELALAKNIEVSSCKKHYTFTLKDSVWSNGQKLTSRHFVQAWKAALDPERGKNLQSKKFFLIRNAKKIYKGQLSVDSLGVSALNERTIAVELEHPATYFLQLLSEPAFSPIFDVNEREPTIFNGPFDVKEFQVEKKLTLKASPSYWDSKTVQLDRIQIHFISDENTALSMYEKGLFDWIGAPFSEISFEALKSIPNVKSLNTSSPFWIYLNTENEKLKSVNIRKALSYSIDRSKLIKEILPHHTELYTILPTELSLIDSSKYVESCTAKNAKVFFEKGLKELGLQRKDFSLTLNYSNCLDHKRIAIYLKSLWEKTFGITIHLKKDEWNTFISKLVSNDYEMGGYYVCNIYNHPSYLLERFEGAESRIISKWSNPSFKDFIERAKVAREEPEQNKYFKKAELILTEEMPVISLYHQNHLFICRENLKNVFPPRFAYADFKWAYLKEGS